MKKSLLAIVFAAASLPLTFAQTTTPATPGQSMPDQTSTMAPKKPKTKTKKHTMKKMSTSSTSTTSTPPQK